MPHEHNSKIFNIILENISVEIDKLEFVRNFKFCIAKDIVKRIK
jgi:hypothetical protein